MSLNNQVPVYTNSFGSPTKFELKVAWLHYIRFSYRMPPLAILKTCSRQSLDFFWRFNLRVLSPYLDSGRAAPLTLTFGLLFTYMRYLPLLS